MEGEQPFLPLPRLSWGVVRASEGIQVGEGLGVTSSSQLPPKTAASQGFSPWVMESRRATHSRPRSLSERASPQHPPGPGPRRGRGGTSSPSKAHACRLPLRLKAHAPPKQSCSEGGGLRAWAPQALAPGTWPGLEPTCGAPVFFSLGSPTLYFPRSPSSSHSLFGLRGKSRQRHSPGARGGAGGAPLTAPSR